MIAALFVQDGGVYFGRPDVDPWPESRDARMYAGPWPVVAHPPCGPWGRYAKPHPGSRARGPMKGDDAGCFAAALASVRRWGGVLEHPKDTGAWAHFGLPYPRRERGWTKHMFDPGWSCLVEQGHYGHAAQKPTWLYYVGTEEPPDLIWGPSSPAPIGSGARRGNLESMSKRQRAATPEPFAAILESLAQGATEHACREFDPDSGCPECQILWAEMVDDMSRPGANVRVTLPADVAPWYDDNAFGATWVADVYQPNGDMLDVFNPEGGVEPVPVEYCRPWRPGRHTMPNGAA